MSTVVETKKRLGGGEMPVARCEVIDEQWLRERTREQDTDVGIPVTINGHDRFATIGSCDEAVYLFDTQDNAREAYYADREDVLALAVVPLDDDWLETAAIALAAKGV